jgi:hypothetical protein
MSIRLDIGRLVLNGIELNATERIQLERDLTGELARLFREAGSGHLISQSTAVPGITAPDIDVASMSGGFVGRQLAHSVFGALSQSGTVPASHDVSSRSGL